MLLVSTNLYRSAFVDTEPCVPWSMWQHDHEAALQIFSKSLTPLEPLLPPNQKLEEVSFGDFNGITKIQIEFFTCGMQHNKSIYSLQFAPIDLSGGEMYPYLCYSSLKSRARKDVGLTYHLYKCTNHS